MEISVVLVVLAIIVGAVSTASDLMRNANGQRIFTEFISAWKSAYIAHTTQVKAVPGDNSVSPTGFINAVAGSELCNSAGSPALTNAMLAHGLEIPSGRGVGQEDRYVYQDGNGSPHELHVCMVTVDWSVPGASSGVFVTTKRHVMHLRGMTTELALQLDALIDGRSDARFGKLRTVALANSTSAIGSAWPIVRAAPVLGSPGNAAEANIGEVEAYLLLN